MSAEPASRAAVRATDVVVTQVVPTRMWHALVDDEVAGKAHVVGRPDGRHFVAIDAWHDTVFEVLLGAVRADVPRELATLVSEADAAELTRWTRAGFREQRRDDEYELPTDAAPPVGAPDGYRLLPAAEVDTGALRRVDERLRHGLPGMRGWVNDPETFAGPAAALPGVSGARSLAAVEEASGAVVGLAHLRATSRWAKLVLLGTLPEHRRRGLGRALLGHALAGVREDGVRLVLAEADATAGPARALLASFGARRTGGLVELVRRSDPDRSRPGR